MTKHSEKMNEAFFTLDRWIVGDRDSLELEKDKPLGEAVAQLHSLLRTRLASLPQEVAGPRYADLGRHRCPRRDESAFGMVPVGPPGPDGWYEGAHCSYCGSLHPDAFMARIRDGLTELGATDKGYKVYLTSRGGIPFKRHYRQCPPDATCRGPVTCTHWTTVDSDNTKFYFQHLSTDQQNEFIGLMNQGALKFQGNIPFYRLPFFVGIKGYDFEKRIGPKPIVYCRRGEEAK